MRCFEVDLNGRDIIPGLRIHTDRRRPYVVVGTNLGHPVYLDDDLIVQTANTGATRLLECGIVESKFVSNLTICAPQSPRRDLAHDCCNLFSVSHGTIHSINAILFSADSRGWVVGKSWVYGNQASAWVTMLSHSELQVVEQWTKRKPGTGRTLFHPLRKAEFESKRYVVATLITDEDGLGKLDSVPQVQEAPPHLPYHESCFN